MKTTSLLARLGAMAAIVLICGRVPASHSAGELHSLYSSGKYFECYRAATEAVNVYTESPVPCFYAAICLVRYDSDEMLKRRVKAPFAGALRYLEKARVRDRSGHKLSKYRKGLRFIQKVIFSHAAKAWQDGRADVRGFLDRMHRVFPDRDGTWANIYHAGTDAVHEDYDFRKWDNPFYRLANTARDVPYVDGDVRKVVYLHNLCRANPKLFMDTYLRKWAGDNFRHPGPYLLSLKADLKKCEPRGFLYVDEAMCRAAASHAEDMARHNTLGHNSTDGTSFSERIRKFVPRSGYCGENCAAGYNDPVNVFMSLLEDHGVSSLGHRQNILNGGYKKIGFATHKTESSWRVWVFDFCGS